MACDMAIYYGTHLGGSVQPVRAPNLFRNLEYRLLHILSSGADGQDPGKRLHAAVSTPLPDADATEGNWCGAGSRALRCVCTPRCAPRGYAKTTGSSSWTGTLPHLCTCNTHKPPISWIQIRADYGIRQRICALEGLTVELFEHLESHLCQFWGRDLTCAAVGRTTDVSIIHFRLGMM